MIPIGIRRVSAHCSKRDLLRNLRNTTLNNTTINSIFREKWKHGETATATTLSTSASVEFPRLQLGRVWLQNNWHSPDAYAVSRGHMSSIPEGLAEHWVFITGSESLSRRRVGFRRTPPFCTRWLFANLSPSFPLHHHHHHLLSYPLLSSVLLFHICHISLFLSLSPRSSRTPDYHRYHCYLSNFMMSLERSILWR